MNRLVQLRTQTNRVRLETRRAKEYYKTTIKRTNHKYRERWITIKVLKHFDFDKVTQDWNPNDWNPTSNYGTRYYVTQTIANFAEYLKDLFCIDHKILLDIRYAKDSNSGYCMNAITNGYMHITIGAVTGIRATTFIHEFLHAAGFDHEYEIDGYSDFRSNPALDGYSKLICKDIFGRKEIFLK